MLEVVWQYGKLVLDSPNANYSFGSLQRVLRKGLLTIGFSRIRLMDNILILGVAGGSVIQTLRKEIVFKGKITGVEIDSEVLKLANTYFKLNQSSNLEIIEADAQDYVHSMTETFDLILVDVFCDNVMPDFLFSESFLGNLKNGLRKKGIIIFNTIVPDLFQEQRNDACLDYFRASGYKVGRKSKLEGQNELLFIWGT
jgi:spermidine synthase